jgi:hypothetical protein
VRAASSAQAKADANLADAAGRSACQLAQLYEQTAAYRLLAFGPTLADSKDVFGAGMLPASLHASLNEPVELTLALMLSPTLTLPRMLPASLAVLSPLCCAVLSRRGCASYCSETLPLQPRVTRTATARRCTGRCAPPPDAACPSAAAVVRAAATRHRRKQHTRPRHTRAMVRRV